MSGGSYNDYSKRRGFKGASEYSAPDEAARRRAEEERATRMRDDAGRTRVEPHRETAKKPEPVRRDIDRNLARMKIQAPWKGTSEGYVILIDNSGSNRAIAEALQRGAGYLHAVMSAVMGDAGVAFQFFSDHCDGKHMIQEVDWTGKGEAGAKILEASISLLQQASGGDEPEAIECALYDASLYDLNSVPKERRHLILVTDQVAHGMGHPGRDDGCPKQKNWQDSLARVYQVYGSFLVVATGDDRITFDLQKKFIAPERRQFDLLDMTTGQEMTHEERCRLVTNAVLFFMARCQGIQTVETFLMMLMEKWVSDPQYGSDTVRRAKGQMADFCAYLEETPERKARLLNRIFAGVDSE